MTRFFSLFTEGEKSDVSTCLCFMRNATVLQLVVVFFYFFRDKKMNNGRLGNKSLLSAQSQS